MAFLGKHWAPIVIVVFVLFMHRDMLLFAVPGTGDHMIHLYNGWHMAEHMLPSGRLTGWSNMAFAGYPSGVYYPILGDLIVSAMRYLTFGLLSWERTYTITFLMLLLAMPLSVYAITRRAASPAGAAFAAFLSLGDVGAWPQGGHYSTVHYAVWPFMLGLTLSMFSLRACEAVLVRPIGDSPGRFLGFVILLSLAVLAHPMTLFFLGFSAPLFMLGFVAARRRQLSPSRALGRAALAALASLLLTGFWTLPWLWGGSQWMFGWPSVGFGGLWLPLPEMFSKLAENDLFKNFSPIAWALGLAGLALALVSRRFWPTFLGVLLVFAFFLTGLCYDLGDGIVLRKVQIERMAPFMKFLWFALAGFSVHRLGELLAFAAGRLSARMPGGLPFFARLRPFAGPFALVLLVIVGWDEGYRKVSLIGPLGGATWKNVVRAEQWVRRQKPRGPLDRVLYQPGALCIDGDIGGRKCDEIYHRHIFASGPVRTHLPKLKFGYEATAIFRNLPLTHLWPEDSVLIKRMLLEPKAFLNLHVRWVISLVKWPPRYDMRKVAEFGNVLVYSAEGGKGPPVHLEGPGRLEVLTFSDERVTVRVEGAGPASRIRYPIAYYYPWRAYHDGKPEKILLAPVLPNTGHDFLMTVGARNGITDLRYERPLRERAAGWTSFVLWIALLALSGIMAFKRLRAGAAR